MAGNERILAVNPGSMTTKIAVYEGERCVYSTSIEHVRETVEAFPTIADQLEFRKEAIMRALGADGELGERFGAVVGRGGLLKSVPSGTYEVNDEMEEDARTGFHGQHASNLGACLAAGLADELGGTPYVVDPVSVDESLAIAAYSGHKDIPRKPFSHALNIRATAKKAARDIGRPLDTINLVVAHLGSGISVVPMVKGRIIDANNAHSGGPFSPERTGTLPLMEMLDFMERDGLDPAAMKHIITRQGGLMSYLGVNDFREVVGRAKGGDRRAKEVIEAMCYQIAKEIGAMATTMSGDVQAIVLTGALAFADLLVGMVAERVSFIADVLVYPGEDELEALARGALEVLRGEAEARIYPTG